MYLSAISLLPEVSLQSLLLSLPESSLRSASILDQSLMANGSSSGDHHYPSPQLLSFVVSLQFHFWASE